MSQARRLFVFLLTISLSIFWAELPQQFLNFQKFQKYFVYILVRSQDRCIQQNMQKYCIVPTVISRYNSVAEGLAWEIMFVRLPC